MMIDDGDWTPNLIEIIIVKGLQKVTTNHSGQTEVLSLLVSAWLSLTLTEKAVLCVLFLNLARRAAANRGVEGQPHIMYVQLFSISRPHQGGDNICLLFPLSPQAHNAGAPCSP